MLQVIVCKKRSAEVVAYNNCYPFWYGNAWQKREYNKGTAAQYGGNISWLIYNMSGLTVNQQPFTPASLVGYSFNYDGANRLKSADFGLWAQNMGGTWNWYPTSDYDVKKLVYLPNGNLDTLQRNNQYGILSDNLKYNYANNNNNMLTSISGSTSSTYTYDNNSSVASDYHRNVYFIIYNSDNLPVSIYTNGQEQQYSYDINGNRIRKYVVGSSDIYYFNSPDGKTEAVSSVATGINSTYNILGAGGDNIGQLRTIGSTTSRYYYLKDHLGTVKMEIKADGTIDSYNDYYPYGSIMPNRSSVQSADTRYKFTSKERDTETGYDYFGARYYDSWLGRWLQVDPLADKYPGWSPYNYTFNNPIRYFDPDGNGPELAPWLIEGGAYFMMGATAVTGAVLSAVGYENTGRAIRDVGNEINNVFNGDHDIQNCSFPITQGEGINQTTIVPSDATSVSSNLSGILTEQGFSPVSNLQEQSITVGKTVDAKYNGKNVGVQTHIEPIGGNIHIQISGSKTKQQIDPASPIKKQVEGFIKASKGNMDKIVKNVENGINKLNELNKNKGSND